MSKVKNSCLPSEKFGRLIKIMTTTLKLVGCDFFMVEVFKFNFFTYLAVIMATLYTIFTTYNIVECILRGQGRRLMHLLSYAGMGLQASAKLFCALANVKNFQTLYRDLCGIFVKYERCQGQYSQIMNMGLDSSRKLIITLATIYAMTTICMFATPICYGLYHNEPIILMEYTLPGVDISTKIGYAILWVNHTILIVMGMFGSFSSDTFLFLIVNCIPMFKNMLKHMLDELDVIIVKHRGNVSRTQPALKTILAWHQTYMDISDRIKMIYFIVIFVEVASITGTIIMSIVCLFVDSFPSGPSNIFFNFVMLFAFCGLGNLVENANDDVTTMIYDCMWYELSVPEQKMILIMLRQSQRAEGMSIGGVQELTLNTGLQITKTIYTITMMLFESLG